MNKKSREWPEDIYNIILDLCGRSSAQFNYIRKLAQSDLTPTHTSNEVKLMSLWLGIS